MTYLREHLLRGSRLCIYAVLWLLLTPVVWLYMKNAK